MSNKTKNKGGTMKICFKKSFTKIIALLFFVIVVMVATVSCTGRNPITPEIGRITVQLWRYIYEDIDFDEFLLPYSEWELKFEEFHYRDSGIVNFSFNRKLINEKKMLELLRKDPKVLRAELKPFNNWESGQIVASLIDTIRDEALEEFLMSYSKYELTILVHDRHRNRFSFLFNHRLINEFDFHKQLEDDDKVAWVSFSYPFPDWTDRILEVQVYEHVKDDVFDDFILTYREYELKFVFHYGNNFYHLSFNHKLIDIFDFLDIIEKDPRVWWASPLYDLLYPLQADFSGFEDIDPKEYTIYEGGKK